MTRITLWGIVSAGTSHFPAATDVASAIPLLPPCLRGGEVYAAVQAAIDGDTITFGPSVRGVIQLQSTPQLTKSLTVQGPGASALALDGRDAVRVLEVTPAACSCDRSRTSPAPASSWRPYLTA